MRASRPFTATVLNGNSGHGAAVVVGFSVVDHPLGDNVVREGLALVNSVDVIESLEGVGASVHVVSVERLAEAHDVVDLVEGCSKLVEELLIAVGEVVGVEVDLPYNGSLGGSVELAGGCPGNEPVAFGGLSGDNKDEVDCPVLLEGRGCSDIPAL